MEPHEHACGCPPIAHHQSPHRQNAAPLGFPVWGYRLEGFGSITLDKAVFLHRVPSLKIWNSKTDAGNLSTS